MTEKHIEERNELFDSTMRETLAGYEPKVPHALWNKIAAELDEDAATGDDTARIPHHHTKGGFAKWRISIAAAMMLTLTAGSILFAINKGETKTGSAVASQVPTPATEQTAGSKTETPTADNATAMATPAKMQNTVRPVKNEVKQQTASVNTAVQESNNTTASVITASAHETAMTAEDQQLEMASPSTENKPVDVGNIPVYSLNFLSSPHTVNDEITVIKSTSAKKKKHGRKEDDETTKVIMFGKKYDSKPDIKYQVPMRF